MSRVLRKIIEDDWQHALSVVNDVDEAIRGRSTTATGRAPNILSLIREANAKSESKTIVGSLGQAMFVAVDMRGCFWSGWRILLL